MARERERNRSVWVSYLYGFRRKKLKADMDIFQDGLHEAVDCETFKLELWSRAKTNFETSKKTLLSSLPLWVYLHTKTLRRANTNAKKKTRKDGWGILLSSRLTPKGMKRNCRFHLSLIELLLCSPRKNVVDGHERPSRHFPHVLCIQFDGTCNGIKS